MPVMSHNTIANSVVTEVFSDDMLESVSACPVCASERSEFVVEAVDNLFFCSHRQWRYFRCTKCSSLYLGNRPKPDTIQLAYQAYYTHHNTTGEVNSLVTTLLRKYLQSRNGGFLFAAVIDLIKPLQSFFEAKTKGIANYPPGRVFDFGCGNGMFLSLCRDSGWEAYGSDFDEAAVQTARARGLSVLWGGIDALTAQPDNSFDLITLSHVIEHLHNPEVLLAECHNKLRKGGILWVETPNANASGLRVFGKNWRGLEPPRHLLLYSKASLINVLIRAQFSSITETRHFLSSTYIFVKSNALRGGNGGKCSMVTAALRGLGCDLKVMRNPATSEFITLACKK